MHLPVQSSKKKKKKKKLSERDSNWLYFIYNSHLVYFQASNYRCYFCTYGCNDLDLCVGHCATEHSDKQLTLQIYRLDTATGLFRYKLNGTPWFQIIYQRTNLSKLLAIKLLFSSSIVIIHLQQRRKFVSPF